MNNRITQFIEYQQISVRFFEQSIGASNGLIRKAIANNTDIQSKWIKAIAENYPQLSLIWLLTGKGDMICDSGVNSSANENIYKKMYKEASKEIAMLNQEIGKLREQLAQSLLEQKRMKNASDAYTSYVKSVG